MALVALTWIPGHLFTGVNAGGAGQYSFVNMMGVYVVARILKQMNLGKIELKKLFLGPVIWLEGILLIGGSKALLQVVRGLPQTSGAWDFLAFYNAPHYWVMAISMLLIFVWHVRVPNWLGKTCLFIAPSMFPIYLMHETTGIGRMAILKFETLLGQTLPIHPVLIITMTTVCVFVSCLLIDLLRRAVISRVAR